MMLKANFLRQNENYWRRNVSLPLSNKEFEIRIERKQLLVRKKGRAFVIHGALKGCDIDSPLPKTTRVGTLLCKGTPELLKSSTS